MADSNMKIAIIIVTYNRVHSFHRLLDSVCEADYKDDFVDLIVSIDKSEVQDKIEHIVSSRSWTHGKTITIKQKERLGLKRHVLQCGDLSIDYDAIIMLEDDLVVSPQFYYYAKSTLSYYENDERVAGISLYKHETHTGVYRPFVPAPNGYDVFAMRFAQSWGQCWSRRMWADFRVWLNANEYKTLPSDALVPPYIMSWNSQSWLKHFMRFLEWSKKYFIYPHYSLSTNCSDAGEHNLSNNNDFQVPLLYSWNNIDLKLAPLDNLTKYDMYYERIDLQCDLFDSLEGNYALDLYGSRDSYGSARYVISTCVLPYVIIKEFALKFRPIELNCIYASAGMEIRVYDLTRPAAIKRKLSVAQSRYDVRAISWKRLLALAFSEIANLFKSKVMRLLLR